MYALSLSTARQSQALECLARAVVVVVSKCGSEAVVDDLKDILGLTKMNSGK